jgi:hypothetical protein
LQKRDEGRTCKHYLRRVVLWSMISRVIKTSVDPLPKSRLRPFVFGPFSAPQIEGINKRVVAFSVRLEYVNFRTNRVGGWEWYVNLMKTQMAPDPFDYLVGDLDFPTW